ncbi:MAG TPA: thioredoxin fold domain-containing protein [Chloroflexia bacterium]|nr:thioredoxin fold domain-containing protein [Chloroflexia bacterium]
MRPVVNGLKQQYGNRLKFVNLDFDDRTNESLEQKYKVNAHPTFIIVDGQGNLVKRWVGIVPADEFKRELELLVRG